MEAREDRPATRRDLDELESRLLERMRDMQTEMTRLVAELRQRIEGRDAATGDPEAPLSDRMAGI